MSHEAVPSEAPSPSGTSPEWHALHEGAVVVPLAHLGGLRVGGPDAADFLQGQLAADVRGLPPGGVRRSLLLDAKGHARAEARVHRREHDLHLAVEDGAASWVEARLRRHVVFDDVEVEGLGDVLCSLTVQGPSVADALAGLGWGLPEGDAFATVPFGDASLLLSWRARSAPGGIDVHLLRRQREEVALALLGAGALPADEGTLEPSRIAAGLARAGLEAGAGVLPQEAGLHDAFSTRKGCYLGQEIIARIDARGRLKRGLVGLRFGGATPGRSGRIVPPGSRLFRSGRVVGRVGGTALHPRLGAIGLGVVRHDVDEEQDLEVEGVPQLRARRVPLPFLSDAGAR